MVQFEIHTADTAPEGAKTILEAVTQRYGGVPNLIGALAEAPVAAEAYVALGDLKFAWEKPAGRARAS